jgi:peptidoglycan hydrolase CwlO-like protein
MTTEEILKLKKDLEKLQSEGDQLRGKLSALTSQIEEEFGPTDDLDVAVKRLEKDLERSRKELEKTANEIKEQYPELLEK